MVVANLTFTSKKSVSVGGTANRFIRKIRLPRVLTAIVASLLLSSQAIVASSLAISLGYGLQVNAFLNSTLKPSLQNLVQNQSARPLVGQSNGTDYNSNWSMTPSEGSVSPYLFMSLPEIRLSSSWRAGKGELGFFSSLTGVVPQTSAYYLGSLQLKETGAASPCSGINYANCPLAAVGFVGSSGTALYDTEVRTNFRSFNASAGLTYAWKLVPRWGGELALQAELGVNIQALSATTQFNAARCTSGASSPCAALSQSRVVQGELKTQSDYALGPQLGMSLRYTRPNAFWFAELGTVVTVLFMRVQNVGYTNFVAGGTVAFTQSASELGIAPVQDSVTVLPAVVLRLGVFL